MLRILLVWAVLLIWPMSAEDGKETRQPGVRYEQVVVTGVWEPVPLGEADRELRVLDVERSELLANTFADLLRLDPSLDLRQRAPNGVQADLSIRGATFGQTLILLNGIRVNDAQSGHHNLDLPVPLEAVSRIEVLKGTGSTQYGSDAIGGVVNFVTRVPETTEFQLRGAVGNFGVNQQRGMIGIASRKLAQQFAFSRDFSSGFAENRDYRNLVVSSISSYDTAAGTGELVLGFSDKPFGADRFYGNFNSWERTKTWYAASRQRLGERTEASIAYRRHTDLFVLYRDQPERFTNRHALETLVGSLRRNENLGGGFRLYYGAEGYGDFIESTNLGRHSRGRGAAYISLDARTWKRLSFNVGLRNEFWGSRNSQFSPSFSAGVWLSPRLKLKGTVSHGFRIPTYTDLYYQDPGNRGSPDLRPERAWNYETGVEGSLSGALRAATTVFHRRESDGIDYLRPGPASVWRATNISRLRFTGIEARVTRQIRNRHQVDFRYTGLRGTRPALHGIVSRYVFNYPVHSGIFSWDAKLPWGILARTRVGAGQRIQRDPFALWDLFVARGTGRWRPFLQFTNLTATVYEEIPGVAMPGRGIVAGVQITVIQGKI